MAILSICIPTYNRIEKLKKSLNFFIEDGVFGYDTELIVSENCCTDGTPQYLDSFSKMYYGKIKIIHQKSNIGGQNNINFLLKLSSGQYTWIVGDDDIIHPGIIKEIFGILNSYHDTAWIFIKHNFLTNEGIIEKKEITSCNGDFKDGIELFRLLSRSDQKLGPMMFTTANIYRTDLMKKGLSIYYKSNEGTNMALSLGLSFYCSANGRGIITKDILITDDVVNISWKDKYVQVEYRDMLAMMDVMAKGMGQKLNHYIDVKKSFFPLGEFYFAFSHQIKDNYTMKYWLKHNPIIIVEDFVRFSGHYIYKIFVHTFIKRDLIKYFNKKKRKVSR